MKCSARTRRSQAPWSAVVVLFVLAAGAFGACEGAADEGALDTAGALAVDVVDSAGGADLREPAPPRDADSAAETTPVADAGPAAEVREDIAAPPAAPPAPTPYAGTCPALAAGENHIEAGGFERSFRLWLPEEPAGAPVIYLWHGVGDSPTNIASFFGAQALADRYGSVVVAPSDACGDGMSLCDRLSVWGFNNPTHADASLAVFDDTLACLDETFDIDNERVYTTGFSAGGIWSTYLVVNRGAYLASAAIFSGGVGNAGLTDLVTYATPAHRLPVLLTWSGENDIYMNVVHFDEPMRNLSAALRTDGHFVVECLHGLGHTIPWGAAVWAEDFLFQHVWSEPSSPLADTGLPDDYPAYCEIPTAE